MGRQRPAQHPAQERGIPLASSEGLQPSSRVGCGQARGLDLPTRRDLKLVPYVVGSVNDEKTLRTDTVDRSADVGLDVKWGVRADLTLDVTVHTDFAQVEADEQQVNLTRFPLFFLKSASFWRTRSCSSSVSRRRSICSFAADRLSATGQPIDIVAGGRLSGKLGGYNVGLLNMQTDDAVNDRTGQRSLPATISPSCGSSGKWAGRISARCS